MNRNQKYSIIGSSDEILESHRDRDNIDVFSQIRGETHHQDDDVFSESTRILPQSTHLIHPDFDLLSLSDSQPIIPVPEVAVSSVREAVRSVPEVAVSSVREAVRSVRETTRPVSEVVRSVLTPVSETARSVSNLLVFETLQSKSGVSREIWLNQLPDYIKSPDVQFEVLFELCSKLNDDESIMCTPNIMMIIAAEVGLFACIFTSLEMGANILFSCEEKRTVIAILDEKYNNPENTEEVRNNISSIIRVLFNHFGASVSGLEKDEMYFVETYNLLGG